MEAPELRSRGGGAALARLDLTEQHAGDLQRLAKFSDKDAAKVAAQYLEHYPVAMAHKVAARCDNGTAWRIAIDTLSRKHHCGFDKRPPADFIHVATRYLCFGVSTAAVEQSFSVLKRLFDEQGLHASDAAEEQTVRVLLSPRLLRRPSKPCSSGARRRPRLKCTRLGVRTRGSGSGHFTLNTVYALSSSEQRRSTLSTSQ